MKTISWADVRALESDIAQRIPGFKVCYKDSSRFQKMIGRLLSPINRDYMTRYTTVMFGRVYFPSKAFCEEMGPAPIYSILRHEAVHLDDMRRFPGVFQLSYLCLLPVGITARAFWEWRAYAETMRVEAELTGRISDETIEYITECFRGSDYGFMLPFPRWVRSRLMKLRCRILADLDTDSQ